MSYINFRRVTGHGGASDQLKSRNFAPSMVTCIIYLRKQKQLINLYFYIVLNLLNAYIIFFSDIFYQKGYFRLNTLFEHPTHRVTLSGLENIFFESTVKNWV